jgi:16S rRNA A1518/A1519 N6-dimethyltransferase RsmA/KsgA/DIM1 with predicted DNA glycosylase/AP lyase activity
MIAAADIGPGDRVLEPSAGTGALLDAIEESGEIVAIEFNYELADALRERYTTVDVYRMDFLSIGHDGNCSVFICSKNRRRSTLSKIALSINRLQTASPFYRRQIPRRSLP